MPYQVPRVQIVPQPDDQVSVQVDGRERIRWHASSRYPRPFFFPIIGPSGRSVTRMGHPADASHDHHRSFWWGHRDIAGVNFWEERPNTPGGPQIRQESWVHYQDGTDEAGLVVRIGWFDAHKVRLLQQELIAVYRPLPNHEGWLELQTTFTPILDALPIAKTNFGFLGLRVAASLTARFGGGRLTNSEGARGEPAIFAKPARWMDYSGPTAGLVAAEGVTWFDHPTNPRYPTPWHVRDDGWMSAAFNLTDGYELRKDNPLRLRYGFHIHTGEIDQIKAEARAAEFAASPAWDLAKGERPWPYQLRRAGRST